MEFIYGNLFLKFYVISHSLFAQCFVCISDSVNTSRMNQYSILISSSSCTGAKEQGHLTTEVIEEKYPTQDGVTFQGPRMNTPKACLSSSKVLAALTFFT